MDPGDKVVHFKKVGWGGWGLESSNQNKSGGKVCFNFPRNLVIDMLFEMYQLIFVNLTFFSEPFCVFCQSAVHFPLHCLI